MARTKQAFDRSFSAKPIGAGVQAQHIAYPSAADSWSGGLRGRRVPMEEAEVIDAGLADFASQWGLRAEAQALLLSLDPLIQLRVLRDFAPKDTTRDVNAVFCKFARTQTTKQAAEAEHATATGSTFDSGQRDFAIQWGLRAESQALLASMEPELQSRVMREFAPRDTSRDVNAVFCKFAHGIMQAGRAAEESNDPIQAFVERWSLGVEAQELFSRLGPNAQLKVMQEFAPRDVGRDVNAIFIKFANGVAAGVPRGGGRGRPVDGFAQHDPGDWHAWTRVADATQPDQEESVTDATDTLLEFVQHWNLNADSRVLLLSLDPQVQEKVMLDFAPRDTTRDVNAIFCKFAWGVAQADQNGEQVSAFIVQWSLREEAQQVLLNLKPSVQQRVMQQFSPRDTLSDANNIFMKFAQGVSRQMERPVIQASSEAQYVHREEVQPQYEKETVRVGTRYQPY